MTGKERKAQERARVEAAERRNAEWLHEHKAWNWQWPGDGRVGVNALPRNCWFTNASTQGGPKESYSGPSDRRKKKRASRRANGRLARTGLKFGRAHSYTRTVV